MRRRTLCIVLAGQLACCLPSLGQVVLTGRMQHPRVSGRPDVIAMSAIRCFANLPGSDSQAIGFRTFETYPAGWYYLPGNEGRYTLVCSSPSLFMRPIVMTNLYTYDGERIDRVISPSFDFAIFHEGSWDSRAATDYYQTFVSRGTSVTHVGFRVVHDGVDGGGPQGQHLQISIHRQGPGTPDTWEQIGPTMPVLDVDSGGPKNYIWSGGWNSGEVPVTPGETYALHVSAQKKGNAFQTFWLADENKEIEGDCYRIGAEGEKGWQGHDMWLAIGTDHDGIVVPYNKRNHKKFGDFAGSARKWAQTYVARGRGLASVILYAAVSGTQPSQNRQRLAVRVREGGPDGPQVGIEKIAIGCANHTGDASWGTFGVACAPGEIPLEPGKTYAIEFEDIENYETLHGYVNIKGVPSDEVPAFNPYLKFKPDDYPQGRAYKEAAEPVERDLDMQVLEYEFADDDWANAVHDKNLLANGDMQAGKLVPDDRDSSVAEGWKRFAVDPGTTHWYMADEQEKANRMLRVIGGSVSGKTVDGGWVQRVEDLSALETYRLVGRVRCSWPVDEKHQCFVGFDPTGQTEDAQAKTIVWKTLPGMIGRFVTYNSDPIRPAGNAISVWLRARATDAGGFPFKADFDDFALRQVRTDVPMPR